MKCLGSGLGFRDPGSLSRHHPSRHFCDGARVPSTGPCPGPAIDHNAGACVRGACVLRVNPLPAGVEEYDWKNGWPLIADRTIMIYGHGVRARK